MKIKQGKPKLLLAVTVPFSMVFLQGQLKFLQQAGFDVAVVCSPGWNNREGVRYFPVAMAREIAICKDFVSLVALIKILYCFKPDIVNAGTPKAGLLVGLAAFLTRIPVRIYTCHGLRLETLTGIKRIILLLTEYLAAFCATTVICVSESLQKKFTALRLAAPDKVQIIGSGSCNGIDCGKFAHAQPASLSGILPQADVVGFVGRLTKDKGIHDLLQAFEKIKRRRPNVHLLLVGDYEEGDRLTAELRQRIKEDPQITVTGFVADVASYYSQMKVLLLPTYREGLPTVILEAGAAAKPVVAYRATGCIDAVIDGVTGFLIPVGDSGALAAATEMLLADEQLAVALGQMAQTRVQAEFCQETVWNNMTRFYKAQWEQYCRKRGVCYEWRQDFQTKP